MIEIYKKDTKGKLRLLRIEAQLNTVVQSSGLVGGKLVTNRRACKPKNIGKKNETTANEQAVLEVNSIVTKKSKEGYYLTKEEALNSTNLMPMLATTIDLDKLVYPVIVQPKLDGIRCIATNKSKLSRKNREFTTLDHINLSELLNTDMLDGEMYAHELSFQENTKLIKKYRRGETEKVKYYVYDLPSLNGNFLDRHHRLRLLTTIHDDIELVRIHHIYNEKQLLEQHQTFLNEGYEGTMIRTLNTKYEFGKRSKSLIKLKDFKDEEYEIVDVIPTEKIPTHGTVVCKIGDTTFKCGNKLSHKEREELLANKDEYIRQQAKVSYFEKTDSGIPRFPVFLGIRMSEDIG